MATEIVRCVINRCTCRLNFQFFFSFVVIQIHLAARTHPVSSNYASAVIITVIDITCRPLELSTGTKPTHTFPPPRRGAALRYVRHKYDKFDNWPTSPTQLNVILRTCRCGNVNRQMTYSTRYLNIQIERSHWADNCRHRVTWRQIRDIWLLTVVRNNQSQLGGWVVLKAFTQSKTFTYKV